MIIEFIRDNLLKKIKIIKGEYYSRISNIYRISANKKIASLSLKYNKISKDKILVEALWDHPHHYLRLFILCKAFYKKYSINNITAIISDRENRYAAESIKSLSIQTLVDTSLLNKDFIHLQEAIELLKDCKSKKDLFELQLPYNYPAYLFYDSELKRQLVGEISGSFDALADKLAEVLSLLDFYNKILDNEYSAVILSHPSTTRFSTIAWIASQKNIPVYVLNYENNHISLRRELEPMPRWGYGMPFPSEKELISDPTYTKLLDIGRKYTDDLLVGRQGQSSLVNVFGAGCLKYKTKREFIDSFGGDHHKPCVVIMGSCWADFPNTYGPTWFLDYVEWIKITLEEIGAIKDINWVLKPHPAEYLYGQKTTLKAIFGDGCMDNVFMWPSGANGNDVKLYADAIVTAAGTSAIEYTTLGITVLVGRETPFTKWSVGIGCNSRGEYVDYLRNITHLNKPTINEINNAYVFTALLLANTSRTDLYLSFPFGLIGSKLWSGMNKYIDKNHLKIDNEISLIINWLDSEVHSYHVYKQLVSNL